MFTQRDATPADAMDVARVHVRSWQVAYRGMLPDAYLDALAPEERAAGYTFGSSDPGEPATIVALDGSEICGFASTGPARRGEAPTTGELLAIYVDPGHWERGVGRMLIDEACGRLRGRGYTDAVLWVLVDNDRARRFYEEDGWAPDGEGFREEIGGMITEEIRYRRPLG